ncbi:DUF87 domain-containing protein [Bacillus sp. FJAT-49705]|uniref:DUF87 domain-containing protein n=2 Tax=Cytobacillus citreus TaxID=2833586 RepID=A0ABS5NVV7_9BACI|nr:DUF87 domain-containing protein [Cytobacillus citreus]
MKLPIVAGLDINGNIIVYDMVKNPHLLIAGETGSGKSTQIRSILSTLIKSVSPERWRISNNHLSLFGKTSKIKRKALVTSSQLE